MPHPNLVRQCLRVLLITTALLTACGTPASTPAEPADTALSDSTTATTADASPDIPPPFHAPTCDPKRTPIVFAHGRNPKTGEEIPISARRVVTFHASQKLKSMVEQHFHGSQPQP